MRYLKLTASQKIRYGPRGVYKHFVVYSNANQASDKIDRKSVSRSVAMFYSRLILQSSKKQRSVATLSYESKYIAIAMYTKQGQQII